MGVFTEKVKGKRASSTGGGRESAESEMSPSFNLQAHRDPQPTVRFCLTASAALQRPGEDVAVQRKRMDLAEVKGCREGMGGLISPPAHT